MPLSDEKRRAVEASFVRFLDARARNLERLRLADLKFNVVALRATAVMLEFDTPRALVESRLAQHLERGTSTAMGTVLQSIAKTISGSGSGVAGADIEVERGGRRYYVQVKSGPDTANKDIAQNIGALLNSARARDPESICVLGVCYGRPEQISSIAKRELDTRGIALKIGREFWEFVSGDPHCMEEILDLARSASLSRAPGEATFPERVAAKVDALVGEFEDAYGKELDGPTWDRFLANNS